MRRLISNFNCNQSSLVNQFNFTVNQLTHSNFHLLIGDSFQKLTRRFSLVDSFPIRYRTAIISNHSTYYSNSNQPIIIFYLGPDHIKKISRNPYQPDISWASIHNYHQTSLSPFPFSKSISAIIHNYHRMSQLTSQPLKSCLKMRKTFGWCYNRKDIFPDGRIRYAIIQFLFVISSKFFIRVIFLIKTQVRIFLFASGTFPQTPPRERKMIILGNKNWTTYGGRTITSREHLF